MRVIAQKKYIVPLGARVRCDNCMAVLMVDSDDDVLLTTPPYSSDSKKAWLYRCPLCNREGYIDAKPEVLP